MNDLILHTVDNEPRVLDVDLAEYLGYSVPRNIRTLIKKHLETLEAMGGAVTRSTLVSGNPVTEFWLTKPQAIFITTQSGTETALRKTAQVVMKFDAYERGLISARPQLPDFTNPVEAARAWADEVEQKQLAQQKLLAVQPKADAWDEFCDADGSINTLKLSTHFGWRSPQALHKQLALDGIIRPVRNPMTNELKYWVPTAKHAGRGLTKMLVYRDGGQTHQQMRWTPKGAEFLNERYNLLRQVEQGLAA